MSLKPGSLLDSLYLAKNISQSIVINIASAGMETE